jgi:hypothetical protein
MNRGTIPLLWAKLDPQNFVNRRSGEKPGKNIWNSPPERIEDSGGGFYKRFFRAFPRSGGRGPANLLRGLFGPLYPGFRAEGQGKRCACAACRQTGTGLMGPWTDIIPVLAP